MKILGVIPSRYESSRFPGKPLAMINGKSMIQRVYEQVKKSSKITDVIVATDDERILNHIADFDGKAIMTSSSHLNGTSRCYEVFEKANIEKAGFYEAVVNIQGDEPFINPEQIDRVCETLIQQKAGIATLAKKIEDDDELFSPNTVKVVFDNSKKALYFSRNPIPFLRSFKKEDWLKNATFYKHIGIYGFLAITLNQIMELKPSNLELTESLEQLRWLENGLDIGIDLTNYESVGIDTPEDLKKLINNI
jgi:3-deoxy-manno-octulosonate cytidylyltransferase (CMP-KDO synthetase)